MNDPIVIDPPDFDQKAAWEECRHYVDDCGGLQYEDDKRNWHTAFGADPGVCFCPLCQDEYYWSWGRVQRCVKCGFEYETDWWAMYSWGGQIAQGNKDWNVRLRTSKLHSRRMEKSKYYRWAFENKAEPSMEAAKSHPWAAIFPEDANNMKGGGK